MRLNFSLNISKKFIVWVVLVLIVIGLVLLFFLNFTSKNPVPANIKNQVSYKIIYPSKASQIDASSYQYQAGQKALSFSVNSEGNKVVFTEQPAPDAIGEGSNANYSAIGIHPYAQFQTKLGQVALTKFYESGTLKSAGQSALLASDGTLLIAHSSQNITNEQWKNLLDSLKISR